MSNQSDQQPLSLLYWVSAWCAYPTDGAQHTVQPKCITNWQEINAKLSDRRHRRSSRTGRYKDTTCQLVDYLSDTPTDVKTLDSTRTCSAHALNTRANFCALIMRRVIRSTPAPPPASSPLHSTPSMMLVNNIGIISIFKWASSPAPAPPRRQASFGRVRFVLIARAFC